MVNASDDDEYIQLTNIWLASAYHYWEAYGFSADESYTYNDTYTTSGSFSESASISITGQTSGTETGSIAGAFEFEFEQAGQNYSIWIPKSVDVSITPDSGQTGAMSYPTFACVYNANSTSSNAVMNCTPQGNSVFTQDDWTMEINTLGNGDWGGLFAYIRASSTTPAVGSITTAEGAPFHASFALNTSSYESGSLSGNGTITMTTTTVNTNNLELAFPEMKCNEINNNYSGWLNTPNKTLLNRPNDPITIIYLLDSTGMNFNISYDLFDIYSDRNVKLSKQIYKHVGFRTSYLFVADSFYTNDIGNNQVIYLKWNFPKYPVKIVPLFVGHYSTIPDELYRYVYGEDRQINAIDAQTAADQQHHDEMMDTSDSAQISTDGNALVEDADEKFGDLFFPLQHAVDTAHDLANVNATGVIRLPAIFKDDYWYLDLTVIERNLPQAWTFIQSLCQLAVAIYMIKGLYNLFFGGGKEDDS